MLKDRLNQDLKAAMLAGDKPRVEALKMLKTAITYKEVELGARETGLTDEQVTDVFTKEAKKRADAAQMYEQGDRPDQAAAERLEQELIAGYLPKPASDEEIQAAIDEIAAGINNLSMQHMGQLIGSVKAKLGSSADGARVAALVKQKLS